MYILDVLELMGCKEHESSVRTTSCVMSCMAFAPMCTPSSVMGMHAEHVREGVKVPEDHAEHCCLPQEYEDQLFKTYQEMKEMVAQPNMFDIPAIQEVFVE